MLEPTPLWSALGQWLLHSWGWLALLPVLFAATTNDTDPSVINVPPGTTSTSTTTVIPQVTVQTSTVNLANGATLNFDFNTDSAPIFDLWIFADQILAVLIFVREGSTGTYRQLGATANTVANAASQVGIIGRRLPGTQVRLQVQNNSGAATTVTQIQAHQRSL